MTPEEDLEVRLAALREAWPVGSVVDGVMDRVRAGAVPPKRRRRRGLLLGLSLSGLAAAAAVWMVLLSQPPTLLASVQQGLQRAGSATVAVTAWDDRGEPHRFDLWYRKGEGVRVETPEQVIVEDGRTQWSWPTGPKAGDPVVVRQRSPGFFTSGLLSKLALPDIRADWDRFRTPTLDREIGGRPCRGYTVPLAELEKLPPGARAVDGRERRALILAEADGRIDLITLERRAAGADWQREREIRIAYDVPVPAEKVAARLPEGARVVDADEAFQGLYPLDRALHRAERGGLILAVHDLQPLKDGEGFYVVSSVRGTPEHLKQYPPRRRPLNPEVTLLDVATQPMTNRMWGGKYDVIGLGEASREGVEYRWWAVVPRRFFEVKEGERSYLPANDLSAMPGEPGRLDDLPGKARVPLAAVYQDDRHRDARGVPEQVSLWAEVPVPAARPAATWEEVAARARRDVLLMGQGAARGLFGVAAGAGPEGTDLRPLSTFDPGAVTDAEYAAAVRRGLDDLRRFDEVRTPAALSGPGPMIGGAPPR